MASNNQNVEHWSRAFAMAEASSLSGMFAAAFAHTERHCVMRTSRDPGWEVLSPVRRAVNTLFESEKIAMGRNEV